MDSEKVSVSFFGSTYVQAGSCTVSKFLKTNKETAAKKKTKKGMEDYHLNRKSQTKGLWGPFNVSYVDVQYAKLFLMRLDVNFRVHTYILHFCTD